VKKKNNKAMTMILPHQPMQMQQQSKKLRKRLLEIKKKQLAKQQKRRLKMPPKLKKKDLQDYKPLKTRQRQMKLDAMQNLQQA